MKKDKINYYSLECFKDLEQAKECLKYWKEKLFLHGWTIRLLLETTLENENGDVMQGDCEFSITTMIATIRVNIMESYNHELTLIHELLHLKYNFIVSEEQNFESNYLDTIEHQNIEKLARTLFMVKYDLDIDCFDNPVGVT